MDKNPGDYANLFQHINVVLDDAPLPRLHFVKQLRSSGLSATFSATPTYVSMQAEMQPHRLITSTFSASTDLSSQLAVKFYNKEYLLNLTGEFSPEYEQTVEDAFYGRHGHFYRVSRNTRVQFQTMTEATTTSILFNQRGKIGAVSSLARVPCRANGSVDVGFEHVNVGSRGIKLSAAGVKWAISNVQIVAYANSTRTAAVGALAQFKRFALAAKIQGSKDDVQAQAGVLKGVGNGQVGVIVDSQKNISVSCRCLLGEGQLEVKGGFKVNGESECCVQWVI